MLEGMMRKAVEAIIDWIIGNIPSTNMIGAMLVAAGLIAGAFYLVRFYAKREQRAHPKLSRFDPLLRIEFPLDRSFNIFVRFFFKLTGTNPLWLSQCGYPDVLGRTLLGVLLVFVTCLAWISSYYFFRVVFSAESDDVLHISLASTFYSLFILSFDLAIVSSTERSVGLIVFRTIVSIVIGVAVSAPITVQLFHASILDRLEKNDSDVIEYTDLKTAENKKARTAKEELRQKQGEADTIQNNISCLTTAMQAETGGVDIVNTCFNDINGGKTTGKANSDRGRNRVYDLLQAKKKELSATKAVMDGDIDRLKEEITAAEEKAGEYQKHATDRKAMLGTDFIGQHRSLWKYIIAGDFSGEGYLALCVIALIMLFDLSVVMAKYSLIKTENYDLFVVEQRKLIVLANKENAREFVHRGR